MGTLCVPLGAQAVPAPAAAPGVSLAGHPGNGSDDPEVRLLERLNEAENAYKEGAALLSQGHTEKGQERLKKAFSVVASSLESDDLAYQVQGDLLNMIEKIRAWESGDIDEVQEEAPSLDASADELKAEPAADIPKGRESRKHRIKIDPENELVKKYIHLYTNKRRKEVEEALARSGRYRDMIVTALRKAGLPEELFWLVMTESEYKLKAISRSGAGGLWQFMPATGRHYGLEVSYWIDERYETEKATKAALRYLSDLYKWFGDWHLALAAYNRGEGGVGRDLSYSRSADFSTLSDRGVLPGETQHYVPKFMACVLIGENPERYGLDPKYDSPEPYDVVELERDLDLGIAAKCADTTAEVLQRLNPQIHAWCTPKNQKNFPLRIPKGTRDRFRENLAKVQDWNPGPQYTRYQVRKGDNLGKIAKRFRTTSKNIATLNGIKNPRALRPGMTLKIKPGKGYRGAP